ncbi:TIGR02265 family protein [Myxococcaceae bacterium GXIMD 01537]
MRAADLAFVVDGHRVARTSVEPRTALPGEDLVEGPMNVLHETQADVKWLGTHELGQRLAFATREDTVRGIFFCGVLDVANRMGEPGTSARLRAEVGELSFSGYFTYPIADFLPLAFNVAQMLAARCGGFSHALRLIGRQSTQDFLSSLAGRTLLALTMSNPRRLVTSIPGAYRATVSYGERKVEWTGERSARITMLRDFMPSTYHEGTLQAALEAIGCKQARVRGRQLSILDSSYELSW